MLKLKKFIFVASLTFLSSVSTVALAAEEYYQNATPPPVVAEVYDSYETTDQCCPKLPAGLIFDRTMSETTGASIFKTVLRGYQALDDAWLPDTTGDKSAYMVLGRFGKTALESVFFAALTTAQHEVFGHGARAREFHLPIRYYEISPFSGFTAFSAFRFNQLTPSERIAIDAAGMEGTGILAKRLRDQFLDCKIIDSRAGLLYLSNILDQPMYAASAIREKSLTKEGHDVINYVAQINQWYGRRVLTTNQLRRQTFIDYLDPYLFFSLFSIGSYIFDGSQCWEYPMIPIGAYHYLPGFRTALAPYGPESQFINYIRGSDNSIQATFRYGKTGQLRSFGASVEVFRLWSSDLLNFDGKCDLWYQPRLFVATANQAKERAGGALFVTGRYRMFECFELLGQVGYKSEGYIPGEPLRSGPILRAGFNLDV